MSEMPPPPPLAIPPDTLTPEAMYRKQVYLNHIAAAEQPLLYTVALQRFLGDLGIIWPRKDVFAIDTASTGSGKQPSRRGAEAKKLKDAGLGWSGVAKKVLGEKEYSRSPKAARGKVRSQARPYLRKSPPPP